jgi:hypothetical protein
MKMHHWLQRLLPAMNGCRILAGLLGLCAGQFGLASALAQSSACPSSQTAQNAEASETKVIVDQVEFRGENPLTESQRADLAQKIQKEPYVLTLGEPQDDWAIEATEVFVRGTFQDLGYLQVEPHGRPYLIRAADHELHFALIIEVKGGPQYRLGQVRVSSTKDKPLALGENVLREQLDLKTGDLLNASNVRSAMEKITKLYSAKGYLDQVPQPIMNFDGKDSVIDLTLQIDEGSAYRISGIDLVGVAVDARKKPLPPQTMGELINEPLWRKYFEDNQELFPSGAKFGSSIKMVRNAQDDTVRLVVDFRACPDTTDQSESAAITE